MTTPMKTHNEEKRVEYIKKMKLIHTPLEERFERITRLLCRSLDVPISAISVIDEERQWFKSIQGASVTEVPRSLAFCAHAIVDDVPMVVSDAIGDPRFASNPFVKGDPAIRFYAGIPLILDEGICIGTLCALDSKPREIADGDLEVLQDLAEIVKAELSSVKLSEAHISLISELKEIERVAFIDELTRLWNKGGGSSLLKKEWDHAIAKSTSIAIARIEVDKGVELKNKYGQETADNVLRHFAATCMTALDDADVLCRWGDNEFLLVLPEGDEEHLKTVLDNMMKAVRTNIYTEPVPLDVSIPVTASIGAYVVSPQAGDDMDSCLSLANKRLIEAKKLGGNQCLIST